ncbi:MAG: type VI secretion system tip protein TssI/VgrG, partial [Gammaproteobacteria bacterium]|nr:type VI secretion system tip protein TssI/VgrG [Gammaproteobacteria bacterium]
MGTWSQANNSIGIETDLGDDVLVLLGLSGSDYVSGMFHYSLDLASEKPDINPKDLIGKKVDVWIKLDDGSKRYINGHIKSFSAKAFVTQGYRHYSAEIVPWIWFMGKKVDCVVYQNQSATQVIEKVLKDEPTANFQISTSKTYNPLEYCVKYLETDLGFITRLMNQNGLYYYFLHDKGKHTLVISDQVADYLDCLEESVIHTEGDLRAKHLQDWQENYEFFTGNWVQQDYNYETPTTDLSASSKTVNDLKIAKDYEFYHYPGDYKKRDDGVSHTDMRMAREEQRYEKISASSNYRSFQAGTKFKVSQHDFDAFKNKEYFITRISHEAYDDTYTTDASGRRVYANRIEAIPAATLFLGEGNLGKPVIYGHQTAVVVGPSGEEIFTDELGRVKVQFHWDRYGQADDTSSCWIRVSQSWAGKNWGAMSLPRIGQEVIVSFEDGDPDRPLIIGRVYNAELKPPHDLPANATMTTMKTNSSKGGGGFNEIRM